MMNEQDIQLALYNYRSFISVYPIVVPNIYLFNWESDLIYLSGANYVTEWEIKISRADYKADFNKKFKHKVLSGKINYSRPVEFYYACPVNMIDISEVPDYAGLYYIRDFQGKHVAEEIKKAPRFKYKISDKQVNTIMAKGLRRYWSLRAKIRITK